MTTEDLERRAAALGLSLDDLPNLTRSFEYSERLVAAARSITKSSMTEFPEDLDVVAFGSLGRFEMTTESDLDFLVLSNLDPSSDLAQEAVRVADQLRNTIEPGHEFREPGSTAIFGSVTSASDLVDGIGLQRDTNMTHTRRILLLEESVSLFRPDRHTELLEEMLVRYLAAKPLSKTMIPRFLLNDLARYWRVLTVDYQAKKEQDSSYSTRYLKLILSRKFTYASSILPLFALAIDAEAGELDQGEEMLPQLLQAFSMPPVVRFIDACLRLCKKEDEILGQGRKIIEILETFNSRLGDGAWREKMKANSENVDLLTLEEFQEGRDLAHGLQVALEAIFFSDQLRHLSQRYLVF